MYEGLCYDIHVKHGLSGGLRLLKRGYGGKWGGQIKYRKVLNGRNNLLTL